MGFVRIPALEISADMSHVVLLLPELEAGGAQRVMLMLAREFTVRGHRVDLVLMCATGALLKEIPEGVCLVDLGAWNHGFGRLGLSMSSVRRLARWVKQERPDVLMSTITGANLVALLARKLAGVSLRLVIREAVTLKNVGSVLRLRAMRWLYPQAVAVVALSPFMRDELVARIGVSSERISCIANPVDVDFIRKQAQASIDHPWLNDDRIQVVVAVGRLITQKDYGALLRAYALIPKEEGLVHLIVVGEGPERPMLERLAADLGIAERVDLVGFDANPWRWLWSADLFVLPSRWEGHPNALLEAMVLGVPVVVSEYDASVFGIFSGFQKYPHCVVNVGDPEMMSEAIMGLVGRKRYKPDDDFERVRDESLIAYEKVLFPEAVVIL